eukprot:2004782-Pyramimonas_sp.AAC.1
MVAQIKNAAGCSAQLRANAAMKATPDALFGSYAHAQSMASRSLARLDCLLASGEAREFAEQGWARAVNPQSARQWVRAAAVNAGASKNKLLEVMATTLTGVSRARDEPLPELSAARRSGRISSTTGRR